MFKHIGNEPPLKLKSAQLNDIGSWTLNNWYEQTEAAPCRHSPGWLQRPHDGQ